MDKGEGQDFSKQGKTRSGTSGEGSSQLNFGYFRINFQLRDRQEPLLPLNFDTSHAKCQLNSTHFRKWHHRPDGNFNETANWESRAITDHRSSTCSLNSLKALSTSELYSVKWERHDFGIKVPFSLKVVDVFGKTFSSVRSSSVLYTYTTR